MNQIGPGHFGHAAIRCDAGEIEVRLSPKGYWQLRTRAVDRDEWRLLCSGGFEEDGALFGSAPPIEDRRIQIGKLLLDAAARRVLVDGREVRLAAREYALLALLCSDPERVFTVPEIRALRLQLRCPRDGLAHRCRACQSPPGQTARGGSGGDGRLLPRHRLPAHRRRRAGQRRLSRRGS